ncbi:DMT family transporter [Methylomicrobium album]|uniref:DMT(Drug/metabolite transporter) superfamily permease n=1 Tax=Methylomicrobium album BG8 TaxID=686340 RepID=H8GGC4_METAL|nr:DMT family transporter [Methylomicrobium album]EIC31204.1 DMT(drug/metabolite transporter) superfamily permease [Methylomicrobium album BG8]
MRIAIAYLCVVLLWATTPLAIKWSGEGPGFLFGVTGRMAIGVVCIGPVLLIMKQPLPWHGKARLTYLAVALQIYCSMIAVYWAAQFIPSGWISVLFGLTPLITALLTRFWLGQRELNFSKLLSYLLGIGGLSLMFGSALTMGRNAALGIAAVILGAFLHSFSALSIKRIGANLPALTQVAGGLLIALPAYLLTWGILDGEWPDRFTPASIASIVYLGMIATTAGFVLYYYLLIQLPAARVALITLISPVLALLLGHAANREPITADVLTGALAILAALFLHEFTGRRGPAKARYAAAEIRDSRRRPADKRPGRYR